MAAFKWDESYSVRVQQCDAEHKKLFEIINQLGMRCGSEKDP